MEAIKRNGHYLFIWELHLSELLWNEGEESQVHLKMSLQEGSENLCALGNLDN